ncbi:hypothetical protein [Streptomyces sp. NRRL S-1868]|uniref:hypothetical protein n=1 Tax=Streptomyces sp. NRRL S-1868 TaxID=1463892 RepID=UPI0004C48F53|nr:hypothetical protein [Streptomyces sp. NRRL S-1868]
MATTTTNKEAPTDASKTEQESPEPLARLGHLHNPGLYLGSGLGIASGWLSGDPLLATSLTAAGTASVWAALGMTPGPWRWLPGQGEPWDWMSRSSRRGYRRTLRRMRRRLAHDHTPPPTLGTAGLLVPTVGIGDSWYMHPNRPALVRRATANAWRARCEILRGAWSELLPDWERGWWRRYTATEMALRAGPLAALPATGYLEMPWWARLAVTAAGSAWGARVWGAPQPAESAAAPLHETDWYLSRWAEWIACPKGQLPGSKLTELQWDENTLNAVIVSTTAKPAESVEQNSVSIAFEVPPRAVNIYRPEDMPANRAKLTVKLRATTHELDTDDLAAVWEEFTPYTGSTLYDPEPTEHGRRFKLLMPRRGSSVTDVQPRAIAQALDLEGEDAVSRLHLRMIDARRIEVNEMTVNPLQDGVPLDLDALVIDEQGYVRVGRNVFGQPARWRLMIPNDGKFGMTGKPGMSAVHSFSSGTTGSGKSSLEETLLIAQLLNGIVSWLADGKYGAGFASWTHVVDWLVKSHYGAMLMAEASARVGKYRFSQQMRMQWRDADGYVTDGRSFFVPGEPFAPMQVTFDEFNEMVLDTGRAHVRPLLEAVSNLGRQTRSAGIGARIYVQIPNLDSIGTDKHAAAIRDMLQSGNIALFRTARADVDAMSLGSRTPEFRLEPIPETFPNGAGTGGLGYIADGGAQYIQSRMSYHPNPVRIARELPRTTLSDAEAEAAGPAYLRRDEYRHLDAADEEEFLRDLVDQGRAARRKNTATLDLAPATGTPETEHLTEDEDEELDELVPPPRSQIVWHAVNDGARRNKQIAQVTSLKPSNVAGATARLERLGKLTKIDRDWHTAEHIDA